MKFSKNVIAVGEGPYEQCTVPMFYTSKYDYEPINITGSVTPEESQKTGILAYKAGTREK